MSDLKSDFKFRPRFRQSVDYSTEEVKSRLEAALHKHREKFHGKIVDNHVILKLREDQQHFWSPQLTLELEDEQGGALVRGLYGPKPAVWTMFVFFYSSIGFLTLMGLIFGLSQMMLKMNPWGLWSVLVGGILLTGLFLMSKVGQGLSRKQMHELNGLLQETLSKTFDTC